MRSSRRHSARAEPTTTYDEESGGAFDERRHADRLFAPSPNRPPNARFLPTLDMGRSFVDLAIRTRECPGTPQRAATRSDAHTNFGDGSTTPR